MLKLAFIITLLIRLTFLCPGGNNGSFGHHILTSEDTLYAVDHSGRGSLVPSQSVTSVIGLTHMNGGGRQDSDGNDLTTTADICQVRFIFSWHSKMDKLFQHFLLQVEHKSPLPSRSQHLLHHKGHTQQQLQQSYGYNCSPTLNQMSTTLPRQGEKRNSLIHHHQFHHSHQHHHAKAYPQAPPLRHLVLKFFVRLDG